MVVVEWCKVGAEARSEVPIFTLAVSCRHNAAIAVIAVIAVCGVCECTKLAAASVFE